MTLGQVGQVAEVGRASLDDLELVLALDAACFTRPWTELAWRSELRDRPECCVWLAGAVGFACAPIVLDTCELRRIAVLPRARNRGHARDLLSAVIAHARVASCVRIELEVAATNDSALSLYRAAGFAEVGRRPRYYLDPIADAVLMTLELAADPAKSLARV